jgi:Mat/Ecp fimbriae periplasmic chaperone
MPQCAAIFYGEEMMMRATMFFGLGMVSIAAHAAPDIHIGAMHDYLAGDKTTLVKRIRNNGGSTAFVRVSVNELVKGENGKLLEQPAASIDYTETQQKATLVASPARLIIAANGMQTTRLMHTGPRDIERYYRLRFVPVAPEEKTGFSAADTARYQQEVTAGVTMLTGYGSVLFVAPKDTRYDTQVNDRDGKITVRNNGNATIVLNDFYDCVDNSTQCSNPTKIHVLPDASRDFAKQAGHTYRFKLYEGNRAKKFDFAS